MAVMIRSVDVLAGEPARENIQRRNELADALRRAQEIVRERLRAGYVHADYIDQWTILKRGNDVFRIRLERPGHHTPVAPSNRPMIWNPRAMVTKN